MKSIATTLFCLAAAFQSEPVRAADPSCQAFEELTLTLERNETDGDTEVVILAKTEDDGLASLVLTAPDGRKAARFLGDRKGIGLREFVLESAEPPQLWRVLASFPEGRYTARGTTVAGDCVEGVARLSHVLAPATQLLSPPAGAVVPVDQVVLGWAPVAKAALYVVEIQNEDLENEHTFEVLPPTTSLPLPAALLVPGARYQFGVAVVLPSGNVTGVEATFETAP